MLLLVGVVIVLVISLLVCRVGCDVGVCVVGDGLGGGS